MASAIALLAAACGGPQAAVQADLTTPPTSSQPADGSSPTSSASGAQRDATAADGSSAPGPTPSAAPAGSAVERRDVATAATGAGAAEATDSPAPSSAPGAAASAERAAPTASSTTAAPGTSASATAPTTAAPPTTRPAATTAPHAPQPGWLGRRPLPTSPDGLALPGQTTPDELRDRRLVTVDTLAPPTGGRFASTIGPLTPDVVARTTWEEGCPVHPDDLRYLAMSFWGFDGRPHTGEMVVHRTVAEDIVAVFATLYDTRFPIEEMRIVTPADLDAAPTGDGNNTTAFVCRAVTGGSSFSQHAYGLAIDLNPFHNPYLRGELLLPELSEVYLDRASGKAGLILDGDAVVRAFAAIGWRWGGHWRSLKDYQHFSLNGR